MTNWRYRKRNINTLKQILIILVIVLATQTTAQAKNTKEEIQLLGDLMYAEVGVLFHKVPKEDAKLAHLLTGSVVINRRNMHFRGATSIKEVIYMKGQYDKKTLKLLGKIKPPTEVYKWAEELLKKGPVGPKNLVYQAPFKQGKVYKKIYTQYFCLTD